MCLAIPALVKEAEGGSGLVEIGGIERTVSFALTPEVKVGDYVLLHTGFAISVLDPEDAQESLRLLSELAEFYASKPDGSLVAEEAPATSTEL